MRKAAVLTAFFISLLSLFSCETDFSSVPVAATAVQEQKETQPEPEKNDESDETEEYFELVEEESDADSGDSLKKWTVLVYMAADNNLEGGAIADFNELENADISDDVCVLVLFDRAEQYDATNGNWTGTRLYRVTKDRHNNRSLIVSEQLDCPELGLSLGSETELDMGNPVTLSAFCEYARMNYAAENYALIIWGHGTGWRSGGADGRESSARAVAVDENSDSYMPISSLRSAILSGMDDELLSFIAFDTCFGMNIECAYELSDCARYMLGTPALVPESGWNYTAVMNRFSQTGKTTADFMNAISEQYAESYGAYSYAFFSCVDLGKIPAFVSEFSDYASSVAAKISTKKIHDEIFSLLTKSCLSYYATSWPTDFSVDIGDALRLLDSYVPSAGVRKRLSDCLVSSWSSSGADSSLALFFGVYQTSTVMQPFPPSMYRSGSRDPLLSRFVSDCTGYVPSEEKNMKSLLDALYYKTF